MLYFNNPPYIPTYFTPVTDASYHRYLIPVTDVSYHRYLIPVTDVSYHRYLKPVTDVSYHRYLTCVIESISPTNLKIPKSVITHFTSVTASVLKTYLTLVTLKQVSKRPSCTPKRQGNCHNNPPYIINIKKSRNNPTLVTSEKMS
ncbi:hypothetical protein CHS0354_003844 [Potamilus streckersoni]|uniref:Uncharacterized protein n=1 Tax=Potamilus streckersoni TaxID=2493646 RepID=A0AAE0SGE3_9BIVA|nr:hypothetical protein CHS0354_003844 [Potamilus streckersoni]